MVRSKGHKNDRAPREWDAPASRGKSCGAIQQDDRTMGHLSHVLPACRQLDAAQLEVVRRDTVYPIRAASGLSIPHMRCTVVEEAEIGPGARSLIPSINSSAETGYRFVSVFHELNQRHSYPCCSKRTITQVPKLDRAKQHTEAVPQEAQATDVPSDASF
jgi:hypothetical protein